MAETQPQNPTAATAQGDPNPDEGKGGKGAILADLAAERDKRQQLEQQVQTLQQAHQAQSAAIQQAFGLKPEETSDTAKLAAFGAQLETLRKDFEQTQRDNQVLIVANEHGISDPEDLALLQGLTDVDAMRKLAARIAKPAEGGSTTSSTPKPDRTQGSKGTPPAQNPADAFAGFLKDQLVR